MRPFKIGVLSESFRLPPREGLRKAKEVGAEGVQIFAVKGEVSPEGLDAQGRADLKAYCAELGLEIAALCGDLGGHGFQVAEDNEWKVPRSKEIVDLAVDLGTNVVTTHIGVVPEDNEHQVYKNMLAACRELGEYAEARGVTFAIETGPETSDVLKSFLDDVGSEGIGVNLDPANLAMVVREEAAHAVRTLGGLIVHTHAKDGVNLKPCTGAQVYGSFAESGIAALDASTCYKEVPLGEGSVDWDAYLDALEEIGFAGFLTIEREVGENPEKDIISAVKFLREKIGQEQ